ncbi:MAG: TRAP transporter small permease [Desulfobacterales bacterium]|jgi:TRAP-type C4-dicarboxylate transport system permease small subunit
MGALSKIKVGWDFISEKVDRITSLVCIVLILFMTVEVIVAVFFRYALDAPIKWGEELARLVMVWAGLLGVSIALKDGEHIGLEALVSRLSGRALAGCNLIVHCLVGIFLAVLLLWGINISIAAWGTFLPALQIKWTWSHLAVPISAGIQLIHLGAMILNDLIALSGKRAAMLG